MPLTRQQKDTLITNYADKLEKSDATILIDYRGLSVSDITELRNSLRKFGGELTVVKNSLVALSLQKQGIDAPEELLVGPTALTLCYGDVQGTAKTLMDFARKLDTVAVKGGILGQAAISAEQAKQLATLPNREVLLARALAGLQLPISGLVSVLGGTIRGLTYVLQARADQLREA